VNRQNLFNRLQLDDDACVDEEVDLEIGRDLPTFVFERNSPLSLVTDSAKTQLHRQTFLIHAFQQARAQCAMYLDGGSDNVFGQLILFHLCVSAPLR